MKLIRILSCLYGAIRITANEKLSHRNVLGSVLGLGVERKSVGDIIINENCCDVILQRDIFNFVLNNLKSVGREKVKVHEILISEIFVPEKEVKERTITVASMRLDAVISSSLGISREKSSELIESERVKVNYKMVTSVKKQIAENDLISVRGYGRISVAKVVGESRSGRIKLKIEM